MRAVDTSVVIRNLTGDDQVQTVKVRAVFDAGDIFTSTPVLLEAEWVLRSSYGSRPTRSRPPNERWPDSRTCAPKALHSYTEHWIARTTEWTSPPRCISVPRLSAMPPSLSTASSSRSAGDPSASMTEPA